MPDHLGKLAVVTGASRGIGAEIAKTLDRAGFNLLLTGRNAEKLNEVAKNLSNKSFIITADLSERSSAEALASSIKSLIENENLRLSALINNAGIYEAENFQNSTPESLYRQFQVNFFSPFLLTKSLADSLQKNQAVVVNISSTLGARPVQNTSIYSSSKAAMDTWTKALALEWASHGVRVVGISPGIVDTPIHSFHGKTTDPTYRQMDSLHPLGRMGSPKNIADAVSYLISTEASWITGVILPVDGGISLT